jgi:hypothetical protein
MALLSLRRPISANRGHEPDTALEALLARMRQRLYPETLPALASCWLKTLCACHHNRAWWAKLSACLDRALRDEPVGPFPRAVLLSTRNWIEQSVLARADAPPAEQSVDSPLRSISAERFVPYVCRLLNEWLPAEVAVLLTGEVETGESGEGIPALARAKALDRLLVRERLSP